MKNIDNAVNQIIAYEESRGMVVDNYYQAFDIVLGISQELGTTSVPELVDCYLSGKGVLD